MDDLITTILGASLAIIAGCFAILAVTATAAFMGSLL